MSLSSRRNGPGPFGRGSWWEGFRCGSGPGLVRVFVPGGVGRLRHGRAGGGAGLRSAPRARAPGSALPAPGEDPPFDAVRDPDGGACGVRIRSGWTLDEENRHRSRAPHALPLCPVGAFKSTIRGRVGQRPGARPRARPAVVRTSGGAVGPVLTRPAATIRGQVLTAGRSHVHAPGDFGSGRGSISPRARRRGRRLRAGRIRRRAHRRERRPATRAGRRTADQRRYAEPGADTSPHAAPRQSRRRRQSGEPQHRIFLPQGPDVSHITSRGRAAEDCRRDQFAQSSLRPASVPAAPRCLTLDGGARHH